MLKSKDTYEIIAPEEIGLARAADDAGIGLGQHSGRNALRTRLQQLGFDLAPAALDDLFVRFKELADTRKRLTDDDVLALLADEVHQPAKAWDVLALQVVCGTQGLPTATVRMLGPDGIARVDWSRGQGMTARTGVVTVPAGLINNGESIVMSETNYAYVSPLNHLLPGTTNFTNTYFLRPRLVDRIGCSDC
jgi:hypothetical protein